MMKRLAMLLVLLAFLFGTNALAEDGLSAVVSAEPLWTEEMTTNVEISLTSSDGFGQGARLTAVLGNGLEAAWERVKLPIWWHFTMVEDGTSIILTKKNGDTVAYNSFRRDDEHGVTVFLPFDGESADGSAPIYMTEPDMTGSFGLYFGFDLVSVKEIGIAMSLQLSLDRVPEWNGCGLCTGFTPLMDVIFSDGITEMALPAAETGFLVPEVPLEVFCDVTGRALLAGEASFALEDSGKNVVSTMRVNGEGLASPKLLKAPLWAFDGTEGETYTLYQTTEDGAGVTADRTVYRIRVGAGSHEKTENGWIASREVTLLSGAEGEGEEPEISAVTESFAFHTDAHGSLIVTRSPQDTLFAAYENTYTSEGRIALKGSVQVEGRYDEARAGEFALVLSENGEEIARTSTEAGGGFILPEIVYHTGDIGVHTYALEQLPEEDESIEYDTEPRYITVSVADLGSGILKAEANVENILLTNRYNAEGVFEIRVNSVLEGRAQQDGEFVYRLLMDGMTLAEAAADADGQAELSCTIDGAFVHANGGMEREVKASIVCLVPDGNTEGVVYDTHQEEITIELSDDGHGQIEATAQPGEVTFTHAYAAAGSFAVAGDVTMQGRDLRDGEFEFVLLENGETLMSARNDANGGILFPALEYTLSDLGTHIYTVQQTSSAQALPGVEMDVTVYTVQIEVADAGRGQLSIAPSVYEAEDGKVHFVNRYGASGEAAVRAAMNVVGGDITSDTYLFTLSDENGLLAESYAAADGSIVFEGISFGLGDAGAKVLTVEAQETDAPAALEGEARALAVLTVTDLGDGTLGVEQTGTPTFTFVYAASGEYIPQGEVTITGRSLRDGEIRYQVTEMGTTVSEGEARADGAIAFTPIRYDRGGIGNHTYLVRQSSADPAGVTGSGGLYTLEVEVTDLGNGVLKAEGHGEPIRFSYAYEAFGTFTPTASVRLADKALADEQFTFEIISDGRVIKTTKNDHTGAVTFYPFTFTEADTGTYAYILRQSGEDAGGIVLDRNEYPLEITVTDNGDGTLSAVQSGGPIAFENAYRAEAAFALRGTVTMEGRTLEADEMRFAAERDGETVALGSARENGEIVFDEIRFTQEDLRAPDGSLEKAKVIPITVRMLEAAEGVICDENEKQVEIILEDGGFGILSVRPSEKTEPLAFACMYESNGEARIECDVKLSGRTLEAGLFTLRIAEKGETVATAPVDENGHAVLVLPLTLKDAGSHVYTVSEDAGTLAGMMYDPSVYTLEAQIRDDGKGRMTAEVSGEQPAFENAFYSLEPLAVTARVSLEGKALAGGEITLGLYENDVKRDEQSNDADGLVRFDPIAYGAGDAGSHRYTISVERVTGGIEAVSGAAEADVLVRFDTQGNPSALLETAEPTLAFRYSAAGEIAVTALSDLNGQRMTGPSLTYALMDGDAVLFETESDAEGRIVFPALALTEKDLGEKTLRVQCVSQAQPGYLLGTEAKDVRIIAQDNGDGTITAKADAEAVFHHRYEAKGTVTFACTVTMTGRSLAAGEIRFGLYEGDMRLAEAANDENGLVSFAPMVFTEASVGTRPLRIVREGTLPPSVDWVGANGIDITATVTDNGDGTLNIVSATPAFLCAYHAVGEIRIDAEVQLTGRKARDGEWVLDLLENGAVIDSVACDENGRAVFRPIETDESGAMERIYTVAPRTLPSSVNGPSGTEVRLTAEDDGEGRLNWTGDSHVILSYVYSASGETLLRAKVETAYAMSGGEFSLALLEDGVPLMTERTDENGEVSFALQYAAEDAGVHTYTMRQEKGNLPGVEYDDSEKQIQVDVSDLGDGSITCTVTGDEAVFVNAYEVTGAYTVSAKVEAVGFDLASSALTLRLLEGGNVLAETQTDAEGQAWFGPIEVELSDLGAHDLTLSAVSGVYTGMTCDPVPVRITVTDDKTGSLRAEPDQPLYTLKALYAASGSAQVAFAVQVSGKPVEAGMLTYTLSENGTPIATGENDGEGNVVFDIPYTQADTGRHVYEIVNTDAVPGMAVDGTVYTVETLVRDDGTGKLTPEVYLPEGGIKASSAYSAAGTLSLQALVTLEGRALEEGEFLFSVYQDGAIVRQARSGADGSIAFEPIEMTLSDVGTHAYTVQQAPANDQGVFCDETAWLVTVSVTDNGDGTLRIASDTFPVFHNIYESVGSAQIVAYVHLTGRTLSEGSFTLDLIGEDGTLLQEKTNDASGTVRFDPISYDLEDVGTRRYTVRIGATAEAGVVTDDRAEEITVFVSDQGNGELTTVVANNGPVFQNAFVAENTLILRPRVVINGGSIEDETLTLHLQDGEANLLQMIRASEGVNAFSPIAFTQDDAGKRFVYTVTCQETGAVYTAEVLVEDRQDGKLTVDVSYTGAEGAADSMLFVWERTVDLTLRALGAEETVGFKVNLYLDEGELMGDYPCAGAYEGTLSSGSVLQIPSNGEVTISGLPADTQYQITCVSVPRYRAESDTDEGTLDRSGVCTFMLTKETADFTLHFSIENQGDEVIEPDPGAITLYANGNAVDAVFEKENNVYTAHGLAKGELDGSKITYTALYRAPETLSVVYESEDAAYRGAVNGSTIRLIGGDSFSVRARYANDDGTYAYKPITFRLYNEEEMIGTYELTPDENGWIVLTGLDRGHQYYAQAGAVKGYTVAYRNVGVYGNVTGRAHDGGTITYQAGQNGPTRRELVLYGAGGAAVIGGGAAVAAALMRRKRRHSSDASENNANE
ncbi:MAG: hypothetical protein IJ174_09600 [Clostridia bacterium]|nr:hypothetical protein [Clostridia bacterium]